MKLSEKLEELIGGVAVGMLKKKQELRISRGDNGSSLVFRSENKGVKVSVMELEAMEPSEIQILIANVKEELTI